MNSIAKMFFSKEKQHDIGRRCSNGNRRVLGDRDVAGEVDTGGLENAFSGQVVQYVRGATTFWTFSVPSFLLLLFSRIFNCLNVVRSAGSAARRTAGRARDTVASGPRSGEFSAADSQRGRRASQEAEIVDLADACEI